VVVVSWVALEEAMVREVVWKKVAMVDKVV
jgi:hypothetical protein